MRREMKRRGTKRGNEEEMNETHGAHSVSAVVSAEVSYFSMGVSRYTELYLLEDILSLSLSLSLLSLPSPPLLSHLADAVPPAHLLFLPLPFAVLPQPFLPRLLLGRGQPCIQ